MCSNSFSSSQLLFCGPSVIDTFCGFPPLLELSCSATMIFMVFPFRIYIWDLPSFFPSFLPSFGSSSSSLSCSFHVHASSVDKPKALSSCSSVLMSVTVFYDTVVTVCVKPIKAVVRGFNQALSHTFVIPLSVLGLLIGSMGRVRDVLVELQTSS